MSTKTKKIISLVLLILPSLMLIMSAVMKLSGAPEVVTGLTKIGLGSYIKLFGVIEIAAVLMLFYSKTYKIGFLLLCCYLGGALSIELAGGQPPMATVFLILIWVGVYLKDKTVFAAILKVEEKK